MEECLFSKERAWREILGRPAAKRRRFCREAADPCHKPGERYA